MDDISDGYTVAEDKLRGVSAIAQFRGDSVRRTYYLCERGLIPVGKEGSLVQEAASGASRKTDTRPRRGLMSPIRGAPPGARRGGEESEPRQPQTQRQGSPPPHSRPPFRRQAARKAAVSAQRCEP